MIEHVSPTQLGMLLRCARQYEYRYVYGLRLPPAGTMIQGTAYHRGLEHALRTKMTGGEVVPEDALDAARDAWERSIEEAAEGVDWGDYHPGELLDQAMELADMYIAYMVPSIDPIVVEGEWRLEDYDIPILGFIDLIDASGNKVVDHKLSRRRANDGGKYQLQLSLYKLGARSIGVEPSGLEIHQAIAGRRERDIHRLIVEPLTANFTDGLITSCIKAIQSGIFPPSGIGSWVCSPSWCGYYEMCRGNI